MTPRRPATRAFSVAELLAVIAIIAIVLSIAVPGLSSVLASSTRSFADNGVRSAVQVARNLAVATGEDAALVVLFEPGGATRLVPARRVATFADLARAAEPIGGGDDLVITPRDVFIADSGLPTTELPAFYEVRGFAPPGLMLPPGVGRDTDDGRVHPEWYAWPRDTVAGGYGGPFTGANDPRRESNWLFPEDGFFDAAAQAVFPSDTGQTWPDARVRSSFMIRFEGRTGRLSRDDREAIFVDPRPGEDGRDAVTTDTDLFDTQQDAWKRVDRYEPGFLGARAWALRVIGEADYDGDTGDGYNDLDDHRGRAFLLGSRSNDTVLVRPVSRLALYDARELAAGVGARRVNRVTRTLYAPFQSGTDTAPRLDPDAFGGTVPIDIRDRINAWIAGDTSWARDGSTDRGFDDTDEPRAKIYRIDATSGGVEEVIR